MNSFANATDLLGSGIDALFDNPNNLSQIPLSDIHVKPQIRQQFENDENGLDELAASIKQRGVLQPILLRPNPNGEGYELVAGERRLRASKLAGLDTIPAHIKNLSDEEAEDAQLAENIQRKNLTQMEEAGKIQRDLDKLGSVEAVLAKHQKSRAWLSKLLGLLHLPEQAKRLINEDISADIEVINMVKTVEKLDRDAAKNLVDDLKNTRGKEDARAKVKSVKAQIKPKKTVQAVITPESLFKKIEQAVHSGSLPEAALSALSYDEQSLLANSLQSWFTQGQNSNDFSSVVAEHLKTNQFGNSGMKKYALLAFLQGAEKQACLNLAKLFI